MVSWGWKDRWKHKCGQDEWVCWCLAGEIVGVVFPAVGSVCWNEWLHACMYRQILEVLNAFLSVADAGRCLLRYQLGMGKEVYNRVWN